MKISNETDLRQEQKLLQIAILSTAVLGIAAIILFMTWGIFSPDRSEAATTTVGAGSTIYASDTPFTNLSSGDTLLIYGKFYIDEDYTALSNDSIVIIVDGVNSEIKLFSGNNIYLGAGSTIELKNSAKIKIVGKCDSTTAIYVDNVLVASCDGTGGTSFDDLNGGGGYSGLPVDWLHFAVKTMREGEVELQWSTASEINNDYFEVEYSSDGYNWLTGPRVGSKAESGHSQSVLEYSATHYPSTSYDKLYYRLVQMDFDGQFEYSDVLPVVLKESSGLKLATLGGSKIKINHTNGEMSNLDLNVYNSTGALILSKTYEDGEVLSLPTPGVYIFEVSNGSEIERIKQVVH